jgi:mono/diheme cytochrome c family protein
MRALVAGVAVVALIVLGAPIVSSAAENSITLPDDHPYGALKPGPGMEAAQRNCLPCHSTDYIQMQPRGDLKQWDGVVTKMIKVFGAPISDADAKAIAEYLAKEYGK